MQNSLLNSQFAAFQGIGQVLTSSTGADSNTRANVGAPATFHRQTAVASVQSQTSQALNRLDTTHSAWSSVAGRSTEATDPSTTQTNSRVFQVGQTDLLANTRLEETIEPRTIDVNGNPVATPGRTVSKGSPNQRFWSWSESSSL